MNNFLGRGWAFPPVFEVTMDKNTGVQKGAVSMVAERDDIEQSLHIILSTSMGERVLRPTFGCNLKNFQFEPLNSGLIAYMRDVVTKALLLHEARIRVDDVQIHTDQHVEGKVVIEVVYIIRMTNSRFNFVYDFYLKN